MIGGVLASQGDLSFGRVAVAALAGALLGDTTGFLLGRGPGRRRYERRGRFLLLRPPHVVRIQALLDRFGAPAFLLARFFPVARVAGPFVFGLSGVRPSRYLPLLAVAAVAWGIGFSSLGYLLGDAWVEVHHWVGRAAFALVALSLAAGIVAWVGRKKWRR